MKHKYLILLLLFSSCKSEFRNDTQQYEVVLEVIYPDRIDTLVFRGWDMETFSSRGSNELRGVYLNKKTNLDITHFLAVLPQFALNVPNQFYDHGRNT